MSYEREFQHRNSVGGTAHSGHKVTECNTAINVTQPRELRQRLVSDLLALAGEHMKVEALEADVGARCTDLEVRELD